MAYILISSLRAPTAKEKVSLFSFLFIIAKQLVDKLNLPQCFTTNSAKSKKTTSQPHGVENSTESSRTLFIYNVKIIF